MNNRFALLQISIFCICAGTPVSGQTAVQEDKVDVFLTVSQSAGSACRKPELGKPLETFAPAYPPEASVARIGGAVKVKLLVGKDGRVKEITEASGPKLLIEQGKKAAEAARFSVSKCNGIPVEASAVLIFNFVPSTLTGIYTSPKMADGFSDITPDSPFYEPILTLTENYGLAFGYADGKYYPDAALTKGDFAHFLRLTLDLLQERAELAGKIPREIDLYFPLNPQRLPSTDAVVDLDPAMPYAPSVGFLISKYDIDLSNAERQFNGDLPLTLKTVLDYWERIFGKDALPVHFKSLDSAERIMSRGEFALFLHETLFVLTYKVLP